MVERGGFSPRGAVSRTLKRARYIHVERVPDTGRKKKT